MKPAQGKAHRDCAVRCISGGAPPAFVVRAAGADGRERRRSCSSPRPDGAPLGPRILDLVAEPVEIAGEVSRLGDQWVLSRIPQRSRANSRVKRIVRTVRAGLRSLPSPSSHSSPTPVALVARACGLFSRRFAVRGQGWAYQVWSKALCRIFGVRGLGARTGAEAAVFSGRNRLSYIDIFVLGRSCRASSSPRPEIDGWPVFGAICRSVNTIFIDRRSKRKLPQYLARIEEALGAGQGAAIFPKGRRERATASCLSVRRCSSSR